MVLDRLGIDDEEKVEKYDFDTSIRAIAHPLRRQILMWLKTPQLYFPEQEYGQELGVCAGQITGRCSLSKSTVSAHLNALKTAGLVSLHKAGTVHFYKRNEDAIQCLGAHLKSLLKGDPC
ncbi:MAG TPA: helix-turn-helix domain-containing protein [Pseudomonas sp.]|uniref:ArsR/SmtB family transcription factor n=1 Tax=Pseudomonas sp. TaxID=306 RepID=UPI002EDA1B78